MNPRRLTPLSAEPALDLERNDEAYYSDRRIDEERIYSLTRGIPTRNGSTRLRNTGERSFSVPTFSRTTGSSTRNLVYPISSGPQNPETLQQLWEKREKAAAAMVFVTPSEVFET